MMKYIITTWILIFLAVLCECMSCLNIRCYQPWITIAGCLTMLLVCVTLVYWRSK